MKRAAFGALVLAFACPAAARPPLAKPCAAHALARSICMVELVMADLRAERVVAEGGIGNIKQVASNSVAVSLLREERSEMLTYTFAIAGDRVTMTGRTSRTRSY